LDHRSGQQDGVGSARITSCRSPGTVSERPVLKPIRTSAVVGSRVTETTTAPPRVTAPSVMRQAADFLTGDHVLPRRNTTAESGADRYDRPTDDYTDFGWWAPSR